MRRQKIIVLALRREGHGTAIAVFEHQQRLVRAHERPCFIDGGGTRRGSRGGRYAALSDWSWSRRAVSLGELCLDGVSIGRQRTGPGESFNDHPTLKEQHRRQCTHIIPCDHFRIGIGIELQDAHPFACGATDTIGMRRTISLGEGFEHRGQGATGRTPLRPDVYNRQPREGQHVGGERRISQD